MNIQCSDPDAYELYKVKPATNTIELSLSHSMTLSDINASHFLLVANPDYNHSSNTFDYPESLSEI